jgi:hypothetical protein
MGFYTKDYLRNLGGETQHRELKFFSESVNESKKSTSFDIFLSHSHEDKEYIRGLYLELTKQGYSVYVDWIVDNELKPSQVTKNTVEVLRKRLKQSKSLVYATSKNALSSKWMPWELGFADGDKGRCAILPITDYESSDFKGLEFLSVYPYVTKDGIKGSPSKQILWVNDSANKYVKMKLWHQGSKPTIHS